MRLRILSLYLWLIILGLYPLAGCAQESDSLAIRARNALNSGQYEEARALFLELVGQDQDGGIPSAVGYLETFLYTGAYEEGLREVNAYLDNTPEDVYLLHMKGRLLIVVGRFEEALEVLQRAWQKRPEFWRNTLELAELLYQMGQQRPARELYATIYRQYKLGNYRTAEEFGIAGRASARLGAYHDANAAFRTGYQIKADHVQNLYWWAELFREKYNNEDAQRTYKEALGINPYHEGVYIGYARSGKGFLEQERMAHNALQVNPNSVDARELLTELLIIDGQYEEAESLIQAAYAINPSHYGILAQQASIFHFRGDSLGLARVEDQMRAINPRAGDFYLKISDNSTRRYRYKSAVAFAQKAVEVERNNWKAYAALGIGLLRLGRKTEARRYLEHSFEQDGFNLIVGNTLTLLDEFDDFAVLESPHFTLRIHKSESDVLGHAMLDYAEACFDSLRARYPYDPPDKIWIEAYNDGDDFAVRVAGVPHLGLLGVSFGDVIALKTPRAQTGGTYNWARTLWHELAHTMAIGVSQHHVPRWFTEGLSVYEEKRARPEWGREMDLEFFSALDQDKLLALRALDQGFTRPQFPGQILLSYYHASRVIEFVVDQKGFQAITSVLVQLGQGTDVYTALENVMGQPLSQMEQIFQAHLRAERLAFNEVLDHLPDLFENDQGDQIDLLESLSGTSDNPFLTRLQKANELLQTGALDQAEILFKEALTIYPDYIGPGNPYIGLAQIYTEEQETSKSIDILEQFLSVSEYGAEQARMLSRLYEQKGDLRQAVQYLDRVLQVEPYDIDTYTRQAQFYSTLNNHNEAVQAWQAILALNPVNEAEVRYQLAMSLYLGGHIQQAKQAVLQALELAPSYREAQKLLLRCVDGV